MTQRATVQLGTSLLLLPLLLIACGGSGTKPAHLTATQTLAPTATPTPSPIIATTYRLTEGSTISYAPPAPDAAGIPPEPLSGTFELVSEPLPQATPRLAEVLFFRVVASLELQSSHFTVAGETGAFVGTPHPGRGQVTMQTTVAINGESVLLVGTAPLSAISNGTISGLQISGSGYSISIFAAASGGP